MACNLGTFTLQRTGTCSQAVAIGRFEIESSCSVFRAKLSVVQSRGRSRSVFFVGNYVLEIEKLCIQPPEVLHL